MLPSSRSSSLFAVIFAAAVAVAVGACAQGAEGTGGDDDPIDASRIDAPVNPNVDARPPVDARIVDAPPVPVDAPVSLPDGGIDLDGGGLFCTSNAECTISGECCFSLGGPGFCVPGTIVGTVCVPS